MKYLSALAAHRVSIRYGPTLAVDHVSFRVEHGEIFGLLGPNGSGKSSLIAAISGDLQPASGVITVDGLTPRDHPEEYAQRIGLVPQELALYEELSVEDNMRFFGSLYGLHGCELTRRVSLALERVALCEHKNSLISQLSGGMQRRVNLACALLHEPPLLLLDEPTVALDPVSRESLFALLDQLRDEGHAVVLTTHLIDEAEQWCDHIGVLRQGQLVELGTPRELARPALDRPVIYGHLREMPSPCWQQTLRERLGHDVEFEVTGRRVRLSAADHEQLGHALALMLAEGIRMDSFRTPPTRLERLLQSPPDPVRSTTCDVN